MAPLHSLMAPDEGNPFVTSGRARLDARAAEWGHHEYVRHVDGSYLRAKPMVPPNVSIRTRQTANSARVRMGMDVAIHAPRKGSRSAQDRAHPRPVDRGDRVQKTASNGNAAFRQVRVRRQELLRPVRCRGWKEHAARSSFNTLDATRDRGSCGLHLATFVGK